MNYGVGVFLFLFLICTCTHKWPYIVYLSIYSVTAAGHMFSTDRCPVIVWSDWVFSFSLLHCLLVTNWPTSFVLYEAQSDLTLTQKITGLTYQSGNTDGSYSFVTAWRNNASSREEGVLCLGVMWRVTEVNDSEPFVKNFLLKFIWCGPLGSLRALAAYTV